MADTLRTTTLGAAVTTTDGKVFQFASVTGVTADTIKDGLACFVDQEYCPIVSVSGLKVTVDRGQGGSAGATHASGATVYIGQPDQFYAYDPVGVPPSPPLVTPWINTVNGTVWTVNGSAWVTTGTGITGLEVGVTTIVGATNGYALYNNAGLLGSTPLVGSGDMLASTYDPATIAQQVVGLTATQTLTNKTLTAPTLTTPALGTPASGVLTNTTGYPASALAGLGSNVATFLGTPTSANLKAAVTDETGSGALVFATSPTFVTPALGSVASGDLTLATGLPISTGVSGLGSNVAAFLATPSSANLAAAITDETGTGSLVFASTPTLVTPVLGAATGTSVNLSSFAKFSGFYQAYISKTIDFTLDETCGTVELLTNAKTFTLPAAASFPNRVFCLKNLQTANVLTVGKTGADTIDNNSSVSVAGGAIFVQSNGVSSWRVLTTVGLDISTVAQGDLIYGSAANTLSLLPKDANATRYLSNTGTTNNPAWAQVALATGVSGDLPFANLAQGSARSVLGVTGNATADVASVQGTADQVLRINSAGTALGFGQINLAASAAVTGLLQYANLVNATAQSVLVGRFSGSGGGVMGEITLGAGLVMSSGGVLSAPTGGSGTVTNTGNLDLNRIVLGNAVVDVKSAAGLSTDGTSQLNLGVAGASTGAALFSGSGSGTVTLTVAAAAGTHTIKLPIADGSANNVLKTDGSGQWGWAAAGAGTVTHTGNLTANAIVLGNAVADTLVVAGITTDGTSIINLGVNATTAGKVKLFGATSGDVTLAPTAAAGTATVLTLPATTDTLVGLAATQTLTNKTLSDSTCKVGNVSDTTKSMSWSLGGATTGTALTLISSHTAARSITFPNATGTLPIILKSSGVITADATGSTAEQNLVSVQLPVLGANDRIRVESNWKFGTATGTSTKTPIYRLSNTPADTSGGFQWSAVPATAANLAAQLDKSVYNANATNSQIAPPLGTTGAGAGAGLVLTGTIDTTATTYVIINIQLANSGDHAQMIGYTITLYPGV